MTQHAVRQLGEFTLDPEAVKWLAYGFCRKKYAVVLSPASTPSEQPILIGMRDPDDATLLRSIEGFLHRPVRGVRLDPYDIHKAIDLGYGRWEAPSHTTEVRLLSDEPPDDWDEAHPIQKALEQLVAEAVSRRASTIHLESGRARGRIDGTLRELTAWFSGHDGAAVHKHLAQLAGVAEGRGGFAIDLQREDGTRRANVETLTTSAGPTAVIALDERLPSTSLGELGIDATERDALATWVRASAGLITLCAPPRHGKSTLLRASEALLETAARRIIRLREMVGPSSAADRLKIVARHDCDVVIADDLVDDDAFLAALELVDAGHLVLATVRAPDAVAVLERLRRAGARDGGLADGLVGSLGLRLLRTLCPHCRSAAPHAPGTFAPVGCERCEGTGYAGRQGIAEAWEPTAGERQAIAAGHSSAAIRSQALTRGVTSMARHGWDRVRAGESSADELASVLGPRLWTEA